VIVAEDPATRPPRAVEPPAELFKFPPNRVAVLFALMEQRMLKRALTVVVSVFLWTPLGAQTLEGAQVHESSIDYTDTSNRDDS